MANILPFDKKLAAISALAEGTSIRSVERMTGIHRDTIMRLAVRVGEGCAGLLDESMHDLPCRRIQLDEIWGFIGKKQRFAKRREQARGLGDVWTYVALDADTKLVPAYSVGKRDNYHTTAFLEDLAKRMKNRVQVSTDGLESYPGAIERGFGCEVDYGQIVKTYASSNLYPEGKYSPPEVARVTKTVIFGSPDVSQISTSYVERQNLTMRMHCRRLTRLTNAFSKKLENFKAAVALHFAYYNFVKIHRSIRMTPAMAAGVADNLWTVEDLIQKSGEHRGPYLDRLLVAVQELNHCAAVHRRTVAVKEYYQGRLIWDGEVEVFDLYHHPTAKICYAWSHKQGKNNDDERFVTVLGLPPVDSPQAAVKVAIASEVRSKKLDKQPGV